MLEPKEKEFVDHFSSKKGSVYHLNKTLDAFWGRITNKVFVPVLLSIYDKLVETNRTKDAKKIWWGDADGDLYYIPNEKRKIIVFTTQSRDYLFVLTPMERIEYNPDAEDGGKIGEEYESYSLHIRRVWRPLEKDSIWDQENILSNINNALDAVETLEEYADDFSKYPQRPGLALYEKIDFDLDEYHDEPRFYGDFRDPGYILSYNDRFFSELVEGTKYSHIELEMLYTNSLNVMAAELDLDLPHLEGNW